MYKLTMKTHLNALSCVLNRIRSDHYRVSPAEPDGTVAMALMAQTQELLNQNLSELEQFCWNF